MKCLESGQKLLYWYSIRPDEPSKEGHAMARLFIITFLPLSVFTCEVSSILFFMKYVAIDFNAAVFSLLQIAIYFGLFYTMIVVAFSRHQITSIFDNLQKIYDSRKTLLSPFSWSYTTAEQKEPFYFWRDQKKDRWQTARLHYSLNIIQNLAIWISLKSLINLKFNWSGICSSNQIFW